jgi:hypothetical protein
MKTIYVFLSFLLGIGLILLGFEMGLKGIFFNFVGGFMIGWFGVELVKRSLDRD